MATTVQPPFRPRAFRCRDGRKLRLRAIEAADAPEIVQAFERLSPQSRYARFMAHKKELNSAALERGVHPQPGRDCALVATVPAADGYDIVGAAQYVHAGDDSARTCEFAITVAEDWRGCGLAPALLASVLRRARRDGYRFMEGWVITENTAMLALARKLGFTVEPVPDDFALLRVVRAL